eukprot:gene11376-23813_t
MAPKKAPPKKDKNSTATAVPKEDDSKNHKEEKLADANKEVAPSKAVQVQVNPNLTHVTFTAASPKEIISCHSGSILADDEPIVPLTEAQDEKVRKLFSANCTAATTTIPASKLAQIWSDFGFPFSKNDIDAVIGNYTKGNTNDLDESQFIAFMGKFHAPSYQYGQRLRNYCARGIVDKVIELVIRGCNPNTCDGLGLSPLHYASEFNKSVIIKELHRICQAAPKESPFCLDLNVQDKSRWTPLHSAVHHGSLEAVKTLIELGADISIPSAVGKTPLHTAASQGRDVICGLLLSAGASINVQDSHNLTPVHEASFRGQEKTYGLLSKAKGVDMSILDKLGNAPPTYLSISYDEK